MRIYDEHERLSELLDEELEADARAQVEAELARSPALRVEMEGLRRARAVVQTEGPTQAPPGFLDAVMDAVDAEEARVGWRARRPVLGMPLQGWALAAAVLLLVWGALPVGPEPAAGVVIPEDAPRAGFVSKAAQDPSGAPMLYEVVPAYVVEGEVSRDALVKAVEELGAEVSEVSKTGFEVRIDASEVRAMAEALGSHGRLREAGVAARRVGSVTVRVELRSP